MLIRILQLGFLYLCVALSSNTIVSQLFYSCLTIKKQTVINVFACNTEEKRLHVVQ